MIVSNRKFFCTGECWFGEEPMQKVHVVSHIQRPTSKPGLEMHSFHTKILDLTKTRDALFSQFKADARNLLRRAEFKDQFVYEWYDTVNPATLSEFGNFYAEFARL